MKKYYNKFLSTKDFYNVLADIPQVKESILIEDMITDLPTKPMTKLFIKPKDGREISCVNMKQFLMLLNSFTALKTIPTISFSQGIVHNVFAYEDLLEMGSKTVKAPAKEEAPIEEVVDTPEVSQEALSEELEVKPSFAIDYAKSLLIEGSLTESKNALEAYGSTFGVDLKKNKTFDNMLIDLVEFVEGL